MSVRKLIVLTLLMTLIILTACRQSETTPTPAQPQALSYDLGEITILQNHFPADSPFREMPVRLEGVIGVPGGDAMRHQTSANRGASPGR
jgi:hypothetical protein